MNDKDSMDYLKANLQHLYEFEMAIRQVATTTGFGDVSMTVTVQNGKVYGSTLIPAVSKRYPKKDFPDTV